MSPTDRLRLRTPPTGRDWHGRLLYPVAQGKGLAHITCHDLTRRATREGYTASTDGPLNDAICREVERIAADRRIDIVEIGGGTGWAFEMLARHARTYINVEPGEPELEARDLARFRDPRYVSIRCSAEDLPFSNASVDLAVSLASLDHIPDLDAALSEISRCLRSGGWFLLELNNRGSWWKRILAGTDLLRRREAVIAREHFVQWTLAECVSHLTDRFETDRAYTMTFFPFVPVVWHVALPLAEAIGKRVVPQAGGNMIVVCRKRP